jgi:pimeloyl-ACP methyl ester carboxylesterase
MDVEFVNIDWAGQVVRIEHQCIARDKRDVPLMVFLHEGLGSLAMWKDFPQTLCAALGCRGLVYSRPGYGQSTTRAPHERWGVDFMHRQAHEILPMLLLALGIDTAQHKPWLFGHSDGGSIALLYAARFPDQVAAVVAVAPHIMVEELSVASIEKTRQAYLQTDLKKRLARYHDEPDSAFWGWNDIWLRAGFKQWSITAEITTIACPVMAVQGLTDEYGTLAQIHGISRCLPQTQVLELANCGHSPHRDQPQALIAAVRAFYRTHAT